MISELQLYLLKTEDISFLSFKDGTFMHTLKQSTTSISFKISFIEVVPIIISFLSALGGFFLIKTKRVCKIGFENLGPIWINSINLSISSKTIRDNGDLYASSNVLTIELILANSEYPTNFSGDITFTKGNKLSRANFAAMAVFPQPFLPSSKILSNGVLAEFLISETKSLQFW